MNSEGITTTAAAAACEPDEALWKFSTTLRVTPLQRHITPFPPPAVFPSQHNLSPRSDTSRRLSAAEMLKRADLTEARHQSRDSVNGELFLSADKLSIRLFVDLRMCQKFVLARMLSGGFTHT